MGLAMADEVQFSISGVEELSAKLKSLPAGVRGKPGRRALGKAATIVARAARQNAERVDDPETGRRIRDNIGRRFRGRHFRRTGDPMISIGVLTRRGPIPEGNPDEGAKGNTPHWHLVEEGTERARAQPFLRPALQDNVGQVISKLTDELSKALDKLAGGG